MENVNNLEVNVCMLLIYPYQSTKDLLYPKKIYTISKCNSIKFNSFWQILYSFYIFECFAV